MTARDSRGVLHTPIRRATADKNGNNSPLQIRQYCLSRIFLKVRSIDHLQVLFYQKWGQSGDLSNEVDVFVFLVTGFDTVKVLQVAVYGTLGCFVSAATLWGPSYRSGLF